MLKAECHLLAVISAALTLSGILTCSGETVQLSLVSVQGPGEDPQTPAGDGNTYDIAAGSTIIIHCNISGAVASASVRYPTNSHAANQRFDDNADGRVSQISANQWMFSGLKAYDTGWVECFDTTAQEQMSSLYIFVNDVNAPLYVPLKSQVVTIYKDEYVPCLPTYSQADVQLTQAFDRNPRTFNNTLGVLLSRRPSRGPPYSCTYSYDGRKNTQPIGTIVVKSDSIPAYPLVVPLHGKDSYQPGETLVMNCTVLADSIAFNWNYSARICEESAPSADCRGSEGRVIQTPATRLRIDPLTIGSTLTITDLSPSDAGAYECGYKIHGGDFMAFRSFSITVYPGPFLDGDNSTVTVKRRAREKVVLVAKLEESPMADITWQFNSQPLDKSSGRFTDSHNAVVLNRTRYKSQLAIDHLEPGDAGIYRLTATIGNIVFVKDFIVEVQAPPVISMKYSYKNVTTLMDEAAVYSGVPIVYVQPALSLRINCMVTSGAPTPVMKWFWQTCGDTNGCHPQLNAWIEILPSASTPHDVLNSPYFDWIAPDSQWLHVTTEKSSRFLCSATNEVDAVDKSVLMSVSVLPEKAEGVGFTPKTRDLAERLVVDDSFLMGCYVSMIHCATANDVQIVGPSDGFVASKNNGEAEDFDVDGDAYKISVKFDNLTTEWNNREYACRCNGGKSGETIKLIVREYEAPKWENTLPAESNLAVGRGRSFLCEPRGVPLPEVTWYKDGKVLKPSSVVFFSKNKYNLTLVRVTLDDSGDYGCVGVTNRDTIYSNFTLTITKPATGLSPGQIAMIVVIVVVVLVLAVIVTICIVRRYCRKKYTPHTLLLPSKEMINPDIPLDEQTDALPYDIGWEFPLTSLKIGMLLGQGAFGRVLKAEAMNIEEGVASTTVAVKTVRDHNDIEQVKALISELKILIHIGQHLNIVNLLGACTKDISKGHILVIVEYCRHGNLRSYILKQKANFNPTLDRLGADNSTGVKLGHLSVDMTGDEDYLNPGTSADLHTAERPVTLRDIISWCYQMANGMEYLASIDYIHRDLAARNVLLADDNIVKICDFGLAKDIYKYQEYQKQTDGPLPIKWMALESLTHKIFNVRTDIWSYGITAWELFSLAATPYPGVDIDDTFIDRLQEGYRMEIPKHCPDQIYQEVMLNCWHPDADKRPNFAELADIMGDWLDAPTKQHLQSLEDPYLRTRDSRTDITIRASSVRRRDRQDLESNYLPTKALQKPNGEAKPEPASSNYYNTSPTSSQPINKSKKKNWSKEPATSQEKLNLRVQLSDEEEGGDGLDMPDMPAPSPSRWERQSHLGRLVGTPEDALSFDSVESENARPPSYHYVMKKKSEAPGARNAGSTSGLARPSPGGSRDALNHSPSDRAYIETTC